MQSITGAAIHYSCDCDVSKTIGTCQANLPSTVLMNAEELKLCMKDERLEREILQVHLKCALAREQRTRDFLELLEKNNKFNGRCMQDLRDQINELKEELASRPLKDQSHSLSSFPSINSKIRKLEEQNASLKTKDQENTGKIAELRAIVHKKNNDGPFLSDEQFKKLATILQHQQTIEDDFLTKLGQQQNEQLEEYRAVHLKLVDNANQLTKDNLDLHMEIRGFTAESEGLKKQVHDQASVVAERDQALQHEQHYKLELAKAQQQWMHAEERKKDFVDRVNKQKVDAVNGLVKARTDDQKVALAKQQELEKKCANAETNTTQKLTQQYGTILAQKLKAANAAHNEQVKQFSNQQRNIMAQLQAYALDNQLLKDACSCSQRGAKPADSSRSTSPNRQAGTKFVPGSLSFLSQQSQQNLSPHDIASPSPQPRHLHDQSAGSRRLSQKRLPRMQPAADSQSPSLQSASEPLPSPASAGLGHSSFSRRVASSPGPSQSTSNTTGRVPQSNGRIPGLVNHNLNGQPKPNGYSDMGMSSPMLLGMGNSFLRHPGQLPQNYGLAGKFSNTLARNNGGGQNMNYQAYNGQQMGTNSSMMPPTLSRTGTPHLQSHSASYMFANDKMQQSMAGAPQQLQAPLIANQQMANAHPRGRMSETNHAGNLTPQFLNDWPNGQDESMGLSLQNAINSSEFQQHSTGVGMMNGGQGSLAYLLSHGPNDFDSARSSNGTDVVVGVKRSLGNGGTQQMAKRAKNMNTAAFD